MKRRIAMIAAVVLAVSALSACTAATTAPAAAADTAAAETVEAAPEAAETAEAAAETTETAEPAAEETAEAAETADVPKSEQTGTAGSNIPLKDNLTEAEALITEAMQQKIEEIYGDQVSEVKIRIDKLYSAEDEQAFDPVASMNLGPNEVAFEATLELLPAEGADVNMLLIPNGEFDEASGWVKNVQRLGVLRENTESSDPKYVITDFGTGW